VSDKNKQKLLKLDKEKLADALLELAQKDDVASDLVEHIIASPKENMQRFKRKLSSLKRSKRFAYRGESQHIAAELRALLQDLESGVDDPCVGLDSVASFYQADAAIFERCDDSYGHIGDVFRYDAKELFVKYASSCEEKEKIIKLLLDLNKDDGYGVCDTLVYCAKEYLSESDIRKMIALLQKYSDQEADKYKKRGWLLLIETLARQIKDAPLFERTRIAAWGKLSTAAYIDIARVYLESGNIQVALSWLEKIPKQETFQARERDDLFLDIYRQLNDAAKLTELLYRKFRAFRSLKSLEELLEVMGKEHRGKVLEDEVLLILAQEKLHENDVEFLLEVERVDDAETYLIDRANQLNGDFYTRLLSLAPAMDEKGRYLAASMIYRALLDSILNRGYTKAYPHGVRYLKKLDKLSALIDDWQSFEDHKIYMDKVRQSHGRKSSFWSKYKPFEG